MRKLGYERHWEVLALLAEGPQFVTELADRLELCKCTVSKTLSLLKRYGVVQMDRVGLGHLHRLDAARVAIAGNGTIVIQFEAADGSRLVLELPPAQNAIARLTEPAAKELRLAL